MDAVVVTPPAELASVQSGKWLEMASFLVFAASFVAFVASGYWLSAPLPMVLASGAIFAHLYQNLTLLDMADLPCTRFYYITLPYALAALYLSGGETPSLSAAWQLAWTCVAWSFLWLTRLMLELAAGLRLNLLVVPAGWCPDRAKRAKLHLISDVPPGIRIGFSQKRPAERALSWS